MSIFDVLSLIGGLCLFLFGMKASDNGPTAIFVTSAPGFDWDVAIIGAVVVVCILVFLRLRKCKQK